MNAADLRDIIADLPDKTEVRLMFQYSWPFEYSIATTYVPEPQPDACGECGLPEESEVHGADGDHDMGPYDEFTPAGSPEAGVLYLVEGTQLGYGTKEAWDR